MSISENETAAEAQPGQKARPVLLGIAALWVLFRLFNKDPFPFWHNIHLPIHEAGHMIFLPFGEFMHFLGGSLFQVAFPLAFTVSFVMRKDLFAAGFTLLWIGDSLIDVSIYVGDAYRQTLPLLGGEHDWAVLLGMLDMTHHADLLGALTWWAGMLTMLAGTAICFAVANHQAGWIKVKL